MLLDDPNNQFGGNDANNRGQDVPGAQGNQGVSNSPNPRNTRGGIKDIFNKYAKQAKTPNDPDTGNGSLKDIFKQKAKQKGNEYAISKGKDFLKNNPTGQKISKKGSELFNKLDQKTGGLSGKLDRAGFTPDMDREEMKQKARDYMKKEGKQEIKKVISDRIGGGVKKGVKEGAEGLAKKGVEEAAELGTKAVVKGGAKLGTDVVVAGGLEAGAETLGAAGFAGGPLGLVTEILAQFVVIAISLGISDAIDGTLALSKGHIKEATHLLMRAGTKVALFIVFVVVFIISIAVLPLVGAIIPLVLIHLYWAGSAIPFVKEMAIMQGLVWWEKLLIVATDVALLFALAITVVVGLFYICTTSTLTKVVTGGPVGAVIGIAGQNSSYCEAFKSITGGLNSPSSPGGSSPGSESGDETIGAFTAPGGSCKFSNVNLCKGIIGGNCSNAGVVNRVQNEWGAKVREQLQQHGSIPGVANSEAFIKAIMVNESGGDPTAESPTGAAGLMQFTTGAANTYGPQCSSSYNSSKEWRKSHPVEQICMSIKYFQSIASGQCGKPRVEVRNLAAGYNRGPGYCRLADGTYTSCSNETGCDGTPVKSWECLWTDAGHSSCNKYVEEGQKYAQYVFGCYTKFNSGN
jgi:hypothetical protein